MSSIREITVNLTVKEEAVKIFNLQQFGSAMAWVTTYLQLAGTTLLCLTDRPASTSSHVQSRGQVIRPDSRCVVVGQEDLLIGTKHRDRVKANTLVLGGLGEEN